MSVSNFSDSHCKKLTRFLFTAAFVASLSACGGGGSGSAAVDDSASFPDAESGVEAGIDQIRNLVLVSQPADVIVPQGKNYSFSVKVDHTHPVTVEWYKDGEMINRSNTSSYGVEAMTEAEAGTYGCLVTDGVLTQECASFSVAISSAPAINIVEHPSNQMVSEGAKVVMSVLAQGGDELDYQWYFEGEAVEGAADPELVLDSVSAADTGEYYVVVTAGSGASIQSESAELKVTANAVTGNALIRWQKPETRIDGTNLAPSDIAGYEIFYSDSESGVMEPLATLDANAQSFESHELSEGDHYFALQTIDRSGLRSEMSAPILVTVR